MIFVGGYYWAGLTTLYQEWQNRLAWQRARAAARKAYRVAAENVPGVKAVKNHMRMPPSSVNMGV